MLGANFGKYGVTDLGINGLGEKCLIASVFQKGSHAETFQTKGHGMAFVEHLHNFRQQDGIRELNFIDLDIFSHWKSRVFGSWQWQHDRRGLPLRLADSGAYRCPRAL